MSSFQEILGLAKEYAQAGAIDGFAVPVRNESTGQVYVGDPDDAEWTFEFRSSPPMTPPTVVHIPAWIFERTDRGKEARMVFNVLASLDFLAHTCKQCGGEHRLIARRHDRLQLIKCC